MPEKGRGAGAPVWGARWGGEHGPPLLPKPLQLNGSDHHASSPLLLLLLLLLLKGSWKHHWRCSGRCPGTQRAACSLQRVHSFTQIMVLLCIVLYCIALHGIVWYCMVCVGIACYCIANHGIALFCMVLHGPALCKGFTHSLKAAMILLHS